ncbi:hypothetical protein ES707_20351 [subsurface metagenome]
MIKIAEIYVPINFSCVREIIPPGVDILYSTLCKGRAEEFLVNQKKIFTWTSHILITNMGIAFTIPLNVSHSKRILRAENLSGLHFYRWHRIEVIPNGFKACGIKDEIRLNCTFILAREVNFESKEKYNERKAQFLPKFYPLNNQHTAEIEAKVYGILYNDYKMKMELVEEVLGEKICFFLFKTVKKRRKNEVKLKLRQAKFEEKQNKKEEKRRLKKEEKKLKKG